jgi:hypothetical protein
MDSKEYRKKKVKELNDKIIKLINKQAKEIKGSKKAQEIRRKIQDLCVLKLARYGSTKLYSDSDSD